jgi:hypothetical protein
MDDLHAFIEVVREQLESLAEVRVKKLDWQGLATLSQDDLATGLYLQGAKDALDYLIHLHEGKLQA